MFKKGVGSVLIGIIIILLGVVATSIIYLYVGNLIEKQGITTTYESQLINSEIEIKNVLISKPKEVTLLVGRESGELPIIGFYVYLYDSRGTQFSTRQEFSLMPLEVKKIVIDYEGSALDYPNVIITKIQIVPIYKIENLPEFLGKSISINYQTGQEIPSTIILGDYNSDQIINAQDINFFCNQWKISSTLSIEEISKIDMNKDGFVNLADFDYYLLAIARTFNGDINFDKSVSIGDLTIIAENYGKNPAEWSEGDINCDGWIGIGDMTLFTENFGQSIAGACSDPDGSDSFEKNAVSGELAFGIIRQDTCGDEDNVVEMICNQNNKAEPSYIKCEYGCYDGACRESPVGLECSDRYDGETDRGINSIKIGDIYKINTETYTSSDGYNYEMEVSRKLLTTDKCIDENNLEEFSCNRDYYEENERKSYIQSTQISCKYGCENGACNLGPDSNFCPDNNPESCITLTPNTICYGDFSHFDDTQASRIKGKMNLYEEDGNYNERKVFTDECINEQTKKVSYCERITENDQYNLPKNKPLTCPSGTSCIDGDCIEIERGFTSSTGDINKDSLINNEDLIILESLVNSPEYSYNLDADIDGDKVVDSYDVYKLSRKIQGIKDLSIELPIREITITTSEEIYNDNPILGTMTEFSNEIPIKTWDIEVSKRGASRSDCNPPILKVNLKNTNSANRFSGFTTYPGYSSLKYDNFRFVSRCTISSHEADSMLREYFIYKIFRKHKIPNVEPIAFAKVNLDSPGYEPEEEYEYLLLQRDNSNKDEINFQYQFGLSYILEADDWYEVYPNGFVDRGEGWRVDRFRKMIIRNRDTLEIMEEINFDPEVAIRYSMLGSFIGLGDRAEFHNEDYGLDIESNYWKHIPFDFDLSFYNGYYTYDETEYLINEYVPEEEKEQYRKKHYDVAREIFDNPNNLYEMLDIVEEYPFRTDTTRMKNYLKLKFYSYALMYGSEEFAEINGQEYIPFENEEFYTKEIERLYQVENLDTMFEQQGK